VESKIGLSGKSKVAGKLDWSKAKLKDDKPIKGEESTSTKVKGLKCEEDPTTRNGKKEPDTQVKHTSS
jgi:hypothetical protein